MRKIICKFKGHIRGITHYQGLGWWYIKCSRCGYKLEYKSPHARLVGMEMANGFTGE